MNAGLNKTYEPHKPCPQLKAGEICFVVEQYNEGKIERLYHEHAPRRRMSRDAIVSTLRCLNAATTKMSLIQIISAHLNTAGKKPERHPAFNIRSAYIEPGVQRLYCGTNTVSWADIVISKSHFRT
ncbi:MULTISPECIES: hypothetical protein [Oceanibaculum]|uniref:hypothetical protein n=1 Tax=Oceanibaculum TaxID=659693 RepID=UPI0012EAFC8A|nr:MULTISPECIES: hypothetical protein [Oceanibaculum]MCH2394291.1 hypothetical protein [Oceanibaculum sp.]